jgi:hypothetical protein
MIPWIFHGRTFFLNPSSGCEKSISVFVDFFIHRWFQWNRLSGELRIKYSLCRQMLSVNVGLALGILGILVKNDFRQYQSLKVPVGQFFYRKFNFRFQKRTQMNEGKIKSVYFWMHNFIRNIWFFYLFRNLDGTALLPKNFDQKLLLH